MYKHAVVVMCSSFLFLIDFLLVFFSILFLRDWVRTCIDSSLLLSCLICGIARFLVGSWELLLRCERVTAQAASIKVS